MHITTRAPISDFQGQLAVVWLLPHVACGPWRGRDQHGCLMLLWPEAA